MSKSPIVINTKISDPNIPVELISELIWNDYIKSQKHNASPKEIIFIRRQEISRRTLFVVIVDGFHCYQAGNTSFDHVCDNVKFLYIFGYKDGCLTMVMGSYLAKKKRQEVNYREYFNSHVVVPNYVEASIEKLESYCQETTHIFIHLSGENGEKKDLRCKILSKFL